MSSADPEEVSVEIEREGVTVEKSFEPDDFPVPAIAFVIRSERDVPVEVTLVDVVPEDIQAEDIGFHPKYGAEHWRNDGDRLIFERTFEGGEEYTTVYGLRARDTEDVGRFLGDPEIAEVDPPKDSGEVVRDVIGEGADPGTSDDDLEAAIAAADVESTPQSPETSRPEREPERPEPEGEAAAVSPESVAAVLADGIKAGRVSDSDLEVIRDALGADEDASNSLEVRIDHLQSEVADLKAYSDALEEFIDENGEARTLMRDLRETIEEVQGDVAGVESEVDSVSNEMSETTGRVEELGEEVSRLDDEVEGVGSEVEEVSSDVEEVGTDVERIESSVSGVEKRVEELDATVADVDEELSSLREEMDDVRGEVDDVRDELPEGRIEAMDDRIEELEAELEELAEMRQRMASVFGGMGGGEAGDTAEDEAADNEADDDGGDDE